MSTPITSLFVALSDTISETVSAVPEQAMFDPILPQLKRPRLSVGREPASLPVVDEWLEPAVSAAPEPWSDLTTSLLEANPNLAWARAYENLDSTPELEAFRSHYCFASADRTRGASARRLA